MGRWLNGVAAPALVAWLAAACGGVVEGGSHEGSKQSTPASAQKTPASQPGSGSDNPDADVDLGACTLGAPEAQAADNACAWVADNRCYDVREMACNCACPRSHDSQCLSGFGSGPNGHVWVACD